MAREPVVAVCTNRSPAQAAEAVGALAAQVPAGRLALVTSGLGEGEVAGHRAAAGPAEVIAEPQPGLARARNRALGWAAARGAGAIAYVDDDAVARPGWWDSLAARWAAAGDDIGVIGGRILPRWTVAPPKWVSDPILPALTLLDLGPGERVVDPERTTLYGANISFAVGPLQEAGGFDPAFGHSGSRIFFSEEDEAQRALVGAGYRVLYVSELVVDHVIAPERLTRRSFVLRRFAYGRALGRRGGRTPRAALRQLSTSGPGSLVALVSGDERKFMERAVRAAENAGVLAETARRG